MTDVVITSSPNALTRVSPDVIGALDLLGITLARDGHHDWRIRIHLNTDTITAFQHTEEPA